MDSRLAILTDYVRQKNAAAAASKLEPKQTWSSQTASVISCPICIFILWLLKLWFWKNIQIHLTEDLVLV